MPLTGWCVCCAACAALMDGGAWYGGAPWSNGSIIPLFAGAAPLGATKRGGGFCWSNGSMICAAGILCLPHVEQIVERGFRLAGGHSCLAGLLYEFGEEDRQV